MTDLNNYPWCFVDYLTQRKIKEIINIIENSQNKQEIINYLKNKGLLMEKK